VQKFLNIYNNTSKKVDNDFGASTVKLVTAFQKDSGLTANGQVNTDTLNKMIDWIKKQV
jgi:peptidoglycan hydrolase-like protein with peptidoglycan-binding domain